MSDASFPAYAVRVRCVVWNMLHTMLPQQMCFFKARQIENRGQSRRMSLLNDVGSSGRLYRANNAHMSRDTCVLIGLEDC